MLLWGILKFWGIFWPKDYLEVDLANNLAGDAEADKISEFAILSIDLEARFPGASTDDLGTDFGDCCFSSEWVLLNEFRLAADCKWQFSLDDELLMHSASFSSGKIESLRDERLPMQKSTVIKIFCAMSMRKKMSHYVT